MLSLGNMFDKARAGDLRLVVDLRLPSNDFASGEKRGRQLSGKPGGNRGPDVALTGDQNALLPVLYAGKSVEAAVADGSLRIDGQAEALARLASSA